ncbi:hypothetical protein H0A36_23530 [Endozoicomonas sp. SM1973]|uniref:Lipoprotein n=1 Tax=Spartinivicinus marinus TaxID=2994442 RepID=A0A853IMI1_9GAMM|nr:hypothetical protein [Spartinivicinus marinus]MCX4025050.1 hypothetical protein [Spartinivicinus marinus]NYZ68996.1 hypothetical protein [Spartinivicinus marinus]
MKALVSLVLVSLLVGCVAPPVRNIQDGYFFSSRSPSLKFKVPSNWKLNKTDSQSGYEDYTKGGESGGHLGTNITREYFQFIENTTNSNQANKVIEIVFSRLEGQYGYFPANFTNTNYLAQKKEVLVDGNRYNTAYGFGRTNTNTYGPKNCYIKKMFRRAVGNKKNSIHIAVYKVGISCQLDVKNNYNKIISQYESELNAVVNNIILKPSV